MKSRTGFRIALIGILTFIIFKYLQVFMLHQSQEVSSVKFLEIGFGIILFILITSSFLGIYFSRKNGENKEFQKPDGSIPVMVDFKNGMKASALFSFLAGLFLIVFYNSTGSQVLEEIKHAKLMAIEQSQINAPEVDTNPETGKQTSKSESMEAHSKNIDNLYSPFTIGSTSILFSIILSVIFSGLASLIFKGMGQVITPKAS
jgi:hypothetical protein